MDCGRSILVAFLALALFGCRAADPTYPPIQFSSEGQEILLLSSMGDALPMEPTGDPNVWEVVIPTEWSGTMIFDPTNINATIDVDVDFLVGATHDWNLLDNTTTLTGVVNWADGTPVVGVTLAIEGATAAGAPVEVATTTGDDGRYSLEIPETTRIQYIRQITP